jgi:hypothetical protein
MMRRYYLLILLTSISIGACHSNQKYKKNNNLPYSEPNVPNIIFDTDIGGDIDDLGALYALNVYADSGLCKIAGVMCSWPMAHHPAGIDAVNTFFGRDDVPVGIIDEAPFSNEQYTWYLAKNFKSDLIYEKTPKSTALYRKLLTNSADTSITIVTVGRLHNLYYLFQSGTDSISPLNGVELVRQKVKEFYMMGGRYDKEHQGEANFYSGGHNFTKYVVDNCPRPITFNGGEIGDKKMGYSTGFNINKLPSNHILKAGYNYFFKYPPEWSAISPSDSILEWSIWDIITVQLAVTGLKNYFDVVNIGYNSIDSTGINTWKSIQDKDHNYVVKKMDPKQYADSVIEKLLLVEPKYSNRKK